ncbi:MAG: NAD(P)H-hydrate dehydratase [Planctomycetota bacterium]
MIRVDVLPRLPRRPRDGHKGTFGTVLVLAGSQGMLGAAILCARGALRGGAGLVRAVLPVELMASFTIAVPPATTLDRAGTQAETACHAADALVVGPGLGDGDTTRALLGRWLPAATAIPVVLDADALNALAPLRGPQRLSNCILTPHPGEAARLLGTTTDVVQRDREGSARELQARSGAVVVLKGAGTVITDGERLAVNRSGNPGLATGGSGDVLTGLLGALCAQGMEPFDAARLAVHVHGEAGDLVASRLSQAGLCADDLPLAIAEVLRGFEDA